ncbi:MAG TPA: maltose ABC transporter substrate-binding protein [Acidimicrobiia bacterium]|jgi:maltose-binding protein MalE
MKVRSAAIAVLLLALALIASACGGDGTSETTAAPTTQPPATEAPTTTVAETTTTVAETTTTVAGDTTTTTEPVVRADADLVIWADETKIPALQPFADQFAADNDLTVAIQELPFGDIRSRLIVAGPAGEGPDIVVAAHDWLGELVAAGAVAPLDISNVADDFSDVAVQAFNYEGTNFGLPYAVENIALIRNTDLVPEAPATFEEAIAIGQQLVADGEAEIPLALQENGNGDPYHNYPIVTALGGYVFGRNVDGSYNAEDLGIDSDGGLAAAQQFSEWAAEGVVNVDVTYDVMIEKFGSGLTPFAITGPWAVGSFGDVNYAVDPFPPLAGGTMQPFIGVQGFMVSAFAENPLIASTFVLDLMATQEAQEALYEVGDRPPAHEAAFQAVAASDPDVQGFGLSGADGYPMPAIPEMGSVWQAWTDAYQLILTGGDPAEAFTNAAEQIRALIAG